MNHLPFAAALLLALSACQSTPVAPSSPLPADVRAHCKNGETMVFGPYKYENNMWGLDKARGFTPEQCLLTREVDGRTEVGWKWHWPGLDYTVFAYPQIMYGWKPWSGGKPSDVRFPLRVDRITQLTIDYAVETEATGSYNLAPEVWLIRDGQWSEKPDPTRISGEIMFWMDYREGTGWTIYSFKSPTRQRSGRIPVHELLAYMVDNKHIRTDEHVASVEFGNEVMGGTGTTWVKRFKVEVGPLRP
jgi:hypothetical protein